MIANNPCKSALHDQRRGRQGRKVRQDFFADFAAFAFQGRGTTINAEAAELAEQNRSSLRVPRVLR
jgi:hypothetical protein